MIRIGQVGAAYGVEGAVKVTPLTDFHDRFDSGSRLLMGGQEHVVEWSREAGGNLVVKLRGIDDRTMAELVRGQYLEVGDEAARPAGEGRFFHHQLIGLDVSTESGAPLGRVEEILQRPANDVWVSRDGAIEHLIPATRDAVVKVDLGAGRVVVADWLVQAEDA
jgi:16S rRNA processing protein RimM